MKQPPPSDTQMKVVGGVIALFIWFAGFYLLRVIGLPGGVAFMVPGAIAALFHHQWIENHRRP